MYENSDKREECLKLHKKSKQIIITSALKKEKPTIKN